MLNYIIGQVFTAVAGSAVAWLIVRRSVRKSDAAAAVREAEYERRMAQFRAESAERLARLDQESARDRAEFAALMATLADIPDAPDDEPVPAAG